MCRRRVSFGQCARRSLLRARRFRVKPSASARRPGTSSRRTPREDVPAGQDGPGHAPDEVDGGDGGTRLHRCAGCQHSPQSWRRRCGPKAGAVLQSTRSSGPRSPWGHRGRQCRCSAAPCAPHRRDWPTHRKAGCYGPPLNVNVHWHLWVWRSPGGSPTDRPPTGAPGPSYQVSQRTRAAGRVSKITRCHPM